MFEQIKGLGYDSKLFKELRLYSVNFFNRVPENSTDRNRAKLFERYQKIIKEQVLERADDLIDALTDMVKDFPGETDIIKADDLLKDVLRTKSGEDLADKITSLEEKLTKQEKKAVYRNELRQLNDTLENVIKELVQVNWAEVSEEDSERLYALSQAISSSKAIIDSLMEQLSIDSNVDLKQGMSILLYLVLRTNAYLLDKISLDSLYSTVSAIQVYAYSKATYLVAD